jgi:hypothetical protein
MRVKHTLWRVSNGWLLVPEDSPSVINHGDAPQCVVFKDLKEFAAFKPKRERNRKAKPTTKEPEHANIT